MSLKVWVKQHVKNNKINWITEESSKKHSYVGSIQHYIIAKYEKQFVHFQLFWFFLFIFMSVFNMTALIRLTLEKEELKGQILKFIG